MGADIGKKLDNKEAVFVAEYINSLDVKNSAITAGYSESLADSKAYQWVRDGKVKPHVHKAIQDGMDLRAKRTQITSDRVLVEIGKLAFCNSQDIYDDDGNLIPIQDLPRDVAAAITEITQKEIKSSNGESVVIERKYKLADKKANLELLGKNLILFTDNVRHTGADGESLVFIMNMHESKNS